VGKDYLEDGYGASRRHRNRERWRYNDDDSTGGAAPANGGGTHRPAESAIRSVVGAAGN